MFNIITDELSNGQTLFCSTHNHYIPLDPANRHYQEVLDAIILEGSDCFEGDIPAELQTAADAKLFAQQVVDYTKAKARLAQHIVSVGREEVVERKLQTVNIHGATIERMMDVVTVTAIEPVEATVEAVSYDGEGEPTTSTIENPLITTDVAERASAQAVVDATPQPVKDHVNGD